MYHLEEHVLGLLLSVNNNSKKLGFPWWASG